MPDNNLRVWEALSKTDPAHTKKFQRAGGFKGTSVKPIWMTRKMTELFGPCGSGWGMGKPEFTVVPAGDNIMVYCTASVWWEKPANIAYGVGGDVVLGKNRNGPFTDDEAFKKAYTDALSNAMKQIGMAADVHMGQHDDDKYVSALAKEFGEGPTEPKPASNQKFGGPLTKTALKDKMRAFAGDLAACEEYDQLVALLNTSQAMLDQCMRDLPDWWYGKDDNPGAQKRIEEAQTLLAPTAEANRVMGAG